jgi:hypothetical protein
MAEQATMWQAQLTDGSKLRGGQTNLFPDDLNVSAVPVEQIKVFTIAHNTFSDTYYAPTRTWYKNGKPWTDRTATVEYLMQDGSLLTVTQLTGGLSLTQQY